MPCPPHLQKLLLRIEGHHCVTAFPRPGASGYLP
jgi:hypothetical protein